MRLSRFKQRQPVFWNFFSGSLVLLWLMMQASSAAAPYRVLMLGDSITAGYGLPTEESLPVKLQQAMDRQLGSDQLKIINGGVSGDTTTGGAARLNWLLSDNIDAVIIALGGNDTLRGINPTQTRTSLQEIIQTLQQRSIPILLTGMQAPRNMGPQFVAAFDAVFPSLAEEYDLLFYPFLLDGVAALPNMNQQDGIHPNSRGVARIIEGLTPFVVQLYQQLQEKP